MGQNEQQGRSYLTQLALILYQTASPKDQISVAHTHTRRRLLHSKWSTPYEYYTPLCVKSFLSAWHRRQAAPQLSERCWESGREGEEVQGVTVNECVFVWDDGGVGGGGGVWGGGLGVVSGCILSQSHSCNRTSMTGESFRGRLPRCRNREAVLACSWICHMLLHSKNTRDD